MCFALTQIRIVEPPPLIFCFELRCSEQRTHCLQASCHCTLDDIMKCKSNENWLLNQGSAALGENSTRQCIRGLVYVMQKAFFKLGMMGSHMQSEVKQNHQENFQQIYKLCSTLAYTTRQKRNVLCYNKHFSKIFPNPEKLMLVNGCVFFYLQFYLL